MFSWAGGNCSRPFKTELMQIRAVFQKQEMMRRPEDWHLKETAAASGVRDSGKGGIPGSLGRQGGLSRKPLAHCLIHSWYSINASSSCEPFQLSGSRTCFQNMVLLCLNLAPHHPLCPPLYLCNPSLLSLPRPPGPPHCSFFFFLIFIWLHQILVAACGSQVWHVLTGSSPLSRDQTRAPCTGGTESQPLDHQGIPSFLFF